MTWAANQKRPWGNFLGMPIERWFRRDDERQGEAAERDAIAEQYRKMVRLKEHYGIEGETGWRPWYDLAVAVISEFDDGLKIIDPPPKPTDKKAARWRGFEGLVLLNEIEALRESVEAEVGKKVCVEALLTYHQELCQRYRGMKPAILKKNYYEALRHHRKSTKF